MIATLTARTRALLCAALAALALVTGASLTHAPTTTHAAPAAPAASYWQYTLGHSRQHDLFCTGTRRGGVTTLRCSRWGYPGSAAAQAPAPAAVHAAVPVPSGTSVPWRGGSPDSYPRGQCTDGAARLAYDNVDHLGNAWQWIGNAIRRGLPTGTVAKLNATVVFQPHVQYAGSLGHVAHVIALGASGSFEIREMNSFGFSPYGGFNRFSTRWVHTGPGVAFIY